MLRKGHPARSWAVAATGKPLAFAADHYHARVRVGVHIAPDIGQFAVQPLIGGGQLARRSAPGAHDELQDALRMAAQPQGLIVRIMVERWFGHGLLRK